MYGSVDRVGGADYAAYYYVAVFSYAVDDVTCPGTAWVCDAVSSADECEWEFV